MTLWLGAGDAFQEWLNALRKCERGFFPLCSLKPELQWHLSARSCTQAPDPHPAPRGAPCTHMHPWPQQYSELLCKPCPSAPIRGLGFWGMGQTLPHSTWEEKRVIKMVTRHLGLGLDCTPKQNSVRCAEGVTVQQNQVTKLSRQVYSYTLLSQTCLYILGLMSLSEEMRCRCLNFSWTFSTRKLVPYVLRHALIQLGPSQGENNFMLLLC